MSKHPLWQRPSWVRRLNLFGTAVGDPARVIPLDPDELLELARSATGLEDLGGGASLEAYRRRVQSIDQDAQAHVVGRLLARGEVLRVLQTRLRLEQHWKRHPAVLEEPIGRPLFVVGAPRTGTTIMLELLALDPGIRAPIAWEAHHPLPHSESEDDRALRLELAEAEQELWSDIQPELMTLHELRSDLPCECVHFMALDFGAGYWGMQYDTSGYDAWAAGQPEILPRTYRLHRRFLQTLQHGGPPRQWLLKTPGHLSSAEALFAEYPDALIVHTHRDPIQFVGSAASTISMLRWLRSDGVDPLVQGQLAHLGFAFMLDHVREARAAGTLPDAQFVDSHFQDLMADPVAAIRKIYEQFQMDWPRDHEERIGAYLRDKPKGKFGKHQYDLATYGIDPEAVRATYAAYTAHYGVSTEAS